jgi:hypothetical protein
MTVRVDWESGEASTEDFLDLLMEKYLAWEKKSSESAAQQNRPAARL